MNIIKYSLFFLIFMLFVTIAPLVVNFVQAQLGVFPLDVSGTPQTKTGQLTVDELRFTEGDYALIPTGITLKIAPYDFTLRTKGIWNQISPWTVSGNNIYHPSGMVGIGTNNPQEALDVGDGSITGVEKVVFTDGSETTAFTRSQMYAHSPSSDGSGPTSMVAAAGREVCMLTGIRLVTNASPRCQIFIENETWKLKARFWGESDTDNSCFAVCLSW